MAVRESLALCEESGLERFANFNRMVLAYLDGLQGGAADADRLLRQGVAYAESRDFTWDALTGTVLLARWLHRRGRIPDARAEFERARAIALASGFKRVADECAATLRKVDGPHADLAAARRESAS
jgi:hypothetical protein